MKITRHISGIEKVTEALGYWPSFHDAEVISFSAERALPLKKDHTVSRLAVHVRRFTTVGEGTVNYDQKLTASVLVRFLFNGVCDLDITDFNHQNVIDSIEITEVEATDSACLRTEIEPIWGFGGSLRCRSIEIEAVEVLPTDNV